ncbi:MAG: hypothetical protein ACRDQ4_00270 [Pseudonocardiaceae bacterium]
MVCAWTLSTRSTPPPQPQLYALHREEGEDGPPGVVAWGLAFPNGDAVTLWCTLEPGSAITVGELWKVEEYHAPNADADLVWLTGPKCRARA